MIDAKTLSPWEQIFSFVASDGYNIHIHSPRLRRHLLDRNYPTILCDVHRPTALQYITTNVVSLKRTATMPEADIWEPIILCKTEYFGRLNPPMPEFLHVDGHHRYVRHALDGRSMIRAFLVEMADWQPFRVYGYPNVSREELLQIPNLKRDYW